MKPERWVCGGAAAILVAVAGGIQPPGAVLELEAEFAGQEA